MGMTLQAIKEAIKALPRREKSSLVAWLKQQDAEAWDKQIEEDFSEGGAGAGLLEAWDTEIKSGKSVPLEDFLRPRQTARKVK
jgi:hypothetical protein